jgi:hypothetical protein
MAGLIAWRKNEGVQCPFCIGCSSHRAPTCKKHDDMIPLVMIDMVNECTQEYNDGEITREDFSEFLENLLSPADGSELVGIRVRAKYQNHPVFFDGKYTATVIGWDVTKRVWTIQYDIDGDTEEIDVWTLHEMACWADYQYVEAYIDAYEFP